jgi:hypothetical protein
MKKPKITVITLTSVVRSHMSVLAESGRSARWFPPNLVSVVDADNEAVPADFNIGQGEKRR